MAPVGRGVALGPNQYGKAEVRLVHVARDTPRHEISDLTVSTALAGVDYLIPTILDMPPMTLDVLELADPHAPYGLRGVGEPPTISSTPAIVAAVRAATGHPLTRVPVRPEHIAGA